MISNKMKEDAAKINSEINILATKMPLAFHNYNYLNEDAKVVLKRRNDQLDEIEGVNDFLKENTEFSRLLNTCKKEFKNINEELKQFGMESDDDSAEKSLEDLDNSSEMKGGQYNNKTISRENSLKDAAAIKSRNDFGFCKKLNV